MIPTQWRARAVLTTDDKLSILTPSPTRRTSRGAHHEETVAAHDRFGFLAASLLSCLRPMDELVNDGKNTENVTTQSMGYDRKSYSPLKQINTSNIKRLVPIWSTSVMNDLGELAAPTIYNGVMYVINGKWTFALDVETGRQIWRTPVELEPGTARRSDHERRGDDLQRQAVSRDLRQPPARARHEDRQGGLEPEIRRARRKATTPPARRSSPTAC